MVRRAGPQLLADRETARMFHDAGMTPREIGDIMERRYSWVYDVLARPSAGAPRVIKNPSVKRHRRKNLTEREKAAIITAHIVDGVTVAALARMHHITESPIARIIGAAKRGHVKNS